MLLWLPIPSSSTECCPIAYEAYHPAYLDALRDWGHAKDYVRMQWLMLQQEEPEDFVIATGVQYSVRQFVIWAAHELGITLEFEGRGIDEKAIVCKVEGNNAPGVKVGDVIMRVDFRYYRPTEVETLLGDPTRAKARLGWEPEIDVQRMCAEMVAHDLEAARKQSLLRNSGFKISMSLEN